jgi:undecaprenyl-diphosphatase
MPIWEAILLGVIQGLTEFLPISSTAHLLVARQLLGHEHPEDAYTTVIQLGTLVAVLWYFRQDILSLTKAVLVDFKTLRFCSSPESRMAWLIVLGTIPVVVIGLKGKSMLRENFYNLKAMAIVAIVFALLMALAEWWTKRRQQLRQESDVTWKDAIWVGLWQALALMPGASRSGTTITAGLFAGLDRAAAARFSFLLSLPSIFAAGVKELYDEYKKLKVPEEAAQSLYSQSTDNLLSLAIGLIVSGVVGYFAIAWLLSFLKRYSTNVFIVYRLLLGTAILVYLFTRSA